MAQRWCLLSEIADVGLGYKSLQNDFYYLDAEAVRQSEIERKFLVPIYRLGDMEPVSYCQHARAQLRVFRCNASERDLSGTGALRYIRAMAGRPANVKKQSKQTLTIKEVLSEQGGGRWYGPKAEIHREHIWLRKAFGTTYAPFLFHRPVIVDQRCNYLAAQEGVAPAALAGLSMSTPFALCLESVGATALGAGALEVATTALRGLRVLDLRQLDKRQQTSLANLAKRIWESEEPVDWQSATPGKNLAALDAWVLERLGGEVSREELYSDLREMIGVRLALAADKGASNKQREEVNLSSLAQSIADHVRPMLEGKRFPENFCGARDALIEVTFEGRDRLLLTYEPMISQVGVSVHDAASNETLFDETLAPSVAEVFARSLLIGRRRFRYPRTDSVADSALTGSLAWRRDVLKQIEDGCARSAQGSSYLDRIRAEAFRLLAMHPAFALRDVPKESTLG